LYSLAFLQNCFEEGSNLAILSRKYKIPDDNPYGEGLVELLDRMLTVDPKARSDMTEVILCLSAVYSGRPLPPRKKPSKPKKEEKESDEARKSGRSERASGSPGEKQVQRSSSRKKKDSQPPENEKAGTFRTDGQGIYGDGLGPSEKKEVRFLRCCPHQTSFTRSPYVFHRANLLGKEAQPEFSSCTAATGSRWSSGTSAIRKRNKHNSS
jgi:hypothetical protein